MQENDVMTMIQSCMAMIRAVARCYGGGEDLIQDGIVGALSAARNFDPEKGAFKPYARLYVVKAISRSAKIRGFEEIVETGCDDVEFSICEIRDAVGRLPERERRFVCSYYGIGCRQRSTSELSSIEGVSEDCIRQVISRARKRLREMLE